MAKSIGAILTGASVGALSGWAASWMNESTIAAGEGVLTGAIVSAIAAAVMVYDDALIYEFKPAGYRFSAAGLAGGICAALDLGGGPMCFVLGGLTGAIAGFFAPIIYSGIKARSY